MKAILILFLTMVVIETSSGQIQFTSPKYGYSFTVPRGWHQKEQVYLPGVDSKFIDDKGNSFIIRINKLPDDNKNQSLKELLENASDTELVEIWAATYDDAYILKRGSTIVDGKEFYFVHLSCPYEGVLRLIHKMFIYNWNGYAVTLGCASISSMTAETSVYFDIMLQSFKFQR